MRRVTSLSMLVLLMGCETYEFPPRLSGLGTDECPECTELTLSETRVPPTEQLRLDADFLFEDERGQLSELHAFVTSPSGEVLEETYTYTAEELVCRDNEDDAEISEEDQAELEEGVDYECDLEQVEKRGQRPGFTCVLQADLDEDVGVNGCIYATAQGDSSLRGAEQGILTTRFKFDADELGDWTVEFVATRASGMESNRLSATVEVAMRSPGDTDGGDTDGGDTDG